MTEFKKATAAVDKMEAAVKAATEESTSPEVKKQLWDEATSLESEWEAKILKMKSKADEKDPDKKVYGEGMAAKVWTPIPSHKTHPATTTLTHRCSPYTNDTTLPQRC